MIETSSILKSELTELVSSREDRLADIRGIHSAQQRIDRYVSLLRDILWESSLCYLAEELSFFNGRCYVPINPRRVVSMLGNILHEVGVGASDIRKIADMPFQIIEERRYDIDESKVCFENCVLDVNTQNVLPFGTSIHTDYIRPFPYSEDARYPMWKQFLNEVMPDEDEQRCLQEFFGMCFLDRDKLSVEKLAIFVGTGSNGKSVVFDVIKSIIGKERVSYLSPDQLANKNEVVSTIGKKLNFAPDIRKGASFDSALKALSSGQEVAGWKLYSGTAVVKCPPLVFALNEMPRFRDTTSAFFRRVMLFSFDITIPQDRQDRSLASRIVTKESSGVFRWMMEGLQRLRSNGGEFTYCEKMERNLEALKRRVQNEENPVLKYLDIAGWSIEEQWSGQSYSKVTATSIFEGMGGRISKGMITRELDSLGVKRDRGAEVRYYLYRK